MGQRTNHMTLQRLLMDYGLILLFLATFIIFCILQERFYSMYNIINLFMQSSLLVIIAVGLTFVVSMDEFDLSIGFLASLAGAIAVKLVQSDFSPILVVLAPIIMGGIAGIINGLVVTRLGLISFVATLGTGTIFIGVELLCQRRGHGLLSARCRNGSSFSVRMKYGEFPIC